MIDVVKFILAGRAVFTLTRPDNKHYTYRINKAEKRHGNVQDLRQTWFVNLGIGYEDSIYLGMLTQEHPEADPVFRLTAKSKFSDDADSVVTFRAFLWDVCNHAPTPLMQFRHEGKCCVCARPLTNPDSIDAGIGPECAGKVG